MKCELYGNPLEHLEADKADCPAYDSQGFLTGKYWLDYRRTVRSILSCDR